MSRPTRLRTLLMQESYNYDNKLDKMIQNAEMEVVVRHWKSEEVLAASSRKQITLTRRQ